MRAEQVHGHGLSSLSRACLWFSVHDVGLREDMEKREWLLRGATCGTNTSS